MKFIYAVSAFVAVAAAQDLGSLPPCGQLCVNNMLGLASSLGCSATDAKCLCGNMNFGNGLRDCSTQACGPAVAGQVLSFGSSYCSQAGASIAGGATSATMTGSAASAATSASAAVSSAASSASGALASASSSISGALASATSSAASAASSAKSAASSGASSASSAAASATSSGMAMKTAAPLAGAGLGALAMLLI